MDDLLSEFLTETAESLGELDLVLVTLEQNPNDPTLLGNIFRMVHTIKGTCGFLGLPRLESVAHASENVLGKIRDNELEVTPAAVTLILQSLDQIKAILAVIEQTEHEPQGDDSVLIAKLNALADGGDVESVAAEETSSADITVGGEASSDGDVSDQAGEDSLFDRLGGTPSVEAAVNLMYDKIVADPDLTPFFAHSSMDVVRAMQRDFMTMAFGGPNEYVGADLRSIHGHMAAQGLNEGHFNAVLGYLNEALKELKVPTDLIAEVMALVEGTRADILCGVTEHSEGQEKPAVTESAENDSEPVAAEAGATKDLMRANQSIRVNVDLLENLMTMVSELVLTRNQLLQMVRNHNDGESEFTGPLQRLNYITTELQEGVMKTRMQPIGNAWAKLPRIVRDLAVDLDKKIDLKMIGAETELDRQVLELIKDPLTHMVRNSGDHGIEQPRDRLIAGKPETGTITLNSFQEGGHIIIRISDDGRGLALDKIKEKIVRNGLVSAADLEGMSDQAIQQFVFEPGFSTAAKVTNVSGRGVGMDVVKTNIEKIGGTIELKTEEGKGTTFTIKIPLTLAIVSALIVECSGERFAIPQISVLELVRASSRSGQNIEKLNDAPVMRLRDRLLPLVSLHDLLKLGAPKEQVGDDYETFVVVTQVGTYTFGIMVDRVFDTEEIVVKPVAPMLRDISVFSGNTILGDGSVIMILDPNGIASASGEMAVADADQTGIHAHAGSESAERIALLVFRAGDDTPKAVPLSLVARLEEIECSEIEHSDGKAVVQYRGQLMPLIPFDTGHECPEAGRQPVVVFTDQERSMGLVVDQILDIVEQTLSVELSAAAPGLMGTSVVAGKATEIVDTAHFLTQAFSDWFGSHDASAAVMANGARTVLLVDDSPFFRNLMAPLLSTAGYDVTTAESADKAIELCEEGRDFDIIISDIEMPGMNGFEFAEAVKNNSRWQNTPMVALSTRASPNDLDRGRQVGFTDYVAKFDRDSLLDTLSNTLSIVRGAA